MSTVVRNTIVKQQKFFFAMNYWGILQEVYYNSNSECLLISFQHPLQNRIRVLSCLLQ